MTDALVLGGGPAGCAAAIQLAQRGASVHLVETAPQRGFKIGETVPPAIREPLEALGVWDRVLATNPLTCPGNLSAWGSDSLGINDFVFDPHGPHGWRLARAEFDAALRDAARDSGVEVTSICPDPHAANFVFDATGRRATYGSTQGAKRRFHDRLVAVHALFQLEDDHDARTMVESAPDGWWYTALLPNSLRIVAFMTDADLLDKELPRSIDRFIAKLRSTRYTSLWIHRHNGQPKSASLGIVHAHSAIRRPFHGPNWLATGDAALSFDPLSSQGILTAITSGIFAANAFLDEDLEGYSTYLDATYDAYLKNLSEYYDLERRWPDAPFWNRRVNLGNESIFAIAEPLISPNLS